VDVTEFFQLFGQSMKQRAFGTQLIQQLLGSIEGGLLNLAAIENAAPTAGDLVFS
jgi:hypothetical protein